MFGFDRLVQHAVRLQVVVRAGQGRHDHHRDMSEVRLRRKFPHNSFAADDGHSQIEQDQIGRRDAIKQLQGREPVSPSLAPATGSSIRCAAKSQCLSE
jgi:hypothetical protein